MRPQLRSALLVVSAASALAVVSLVAPRAQTATRTDRTVIGGLSVETFAHGLDHPWSLAFLPDGRLLVTERPGRMRLVDKQGGLSPPLAGVPKVFARGQGGLLDVALDREFTDNRIVYFCFAEPGTGGGRTSLARARLSDASRLEDVKVIFRQQGPLSTGNHFGCRVTPAAGGYLFLTTGEHFTHRDQAQKLDNHLGKIIRIRTDGSVPPDNPFVGRKDALPEIWSYGHRNIQGAALQPGTDVYWEVEHGAMGGDEINIPRPGRNYGWPVISYGRNYGGSKIGVGTHREGMEQPLHYWDPSIAPSGMAFYTGDLFPAWRGSVFVGALAGEMLVRLPVDGETVGREERLLHGLGERIRDVRAGPDGALWLLTDDSRGRILRVTPAP